MCFLFAPQLVAQAKYDVKKVNENVYILTEPWKGNTHGNLGVLIGNDQGLLINSMMMNSASSLEKETQKMMIAFGVKTLHHNFKN